MGCICDGAAVADDYENMAKSSKPSTSMDISHINKNGLPNIGNTCYLNSIIQLLYSAETFRNEVVAVAKANSRLIFHVYLSNIFQDITHSASMTKKQMDLLQIVNFLQKKQEKFTIYRQNDAIDVLLSVLNLLDDEDPSNCKLKYFKTVCVQTCQCTASRGGLTVDQYFFQDGNFCDTCHQRTECKIKYPGKYLLFLPNNNMKNEVQRIQFETWDNKKIKFISQTFIIYNGNGQSGHYYAYRKVNKKWIEINDSKVRYVSNDAKPTQIPMIVLLKLQEGSTK